jgi:hypothetical protein
MCITGGVAKRNLRTVPPLSKAPQGAGLSWRTEGCLLGKLIISPLRGFAPGEANPGVALCYTPGYAYLASARLITDFAKKWIN